jgi:hypothetical protein
VSEHRPIPGAPERDDSPGLDIEALRERVAKLEAVVSPEAARAATRREIKRLQAELEELG